MQLLAFHQITLSRLPHAVSHLRCGTQTVGQLSLAHCLSSFEGGATASRQPVEATASFLLYEGMYA